MKLEEVKFEPSEFVKGMREGFANPDVPLRAESYDRISILAATAISWLAPAGCQCHTTAHQS